MRPILPAALLLLAAPLAAQAVCTTPGRLEETFRMGSADGAVALTQPVWGLELDDAGNLYVAQGRIPWIEVYDPRGAPLRRIGSGGQGPGEFAFGPGAIGWKGDTLWAVEPLGAGAHLFGPDGREATRVKFSTPFPSEASTFSAGALLADGSVLGSRGVSSQMTGSMDAFFEKARFPILRFSRTGEILDTIATVGWSSDPYMILQLPSAGGRTIRHDARHPLQDYAMYGNTWARLPFGTTRDGSGVVFVDVAPPPVERRRFSPLRLLDRMVGTRGSFTILRIGVAGDTLLARSMPYTRQPITAADADWLRGEFAAIVAGDHMPSSGPMANPFAPDDAVRARRRASAREDLTLPEFFPPVRSILAGADGSIWLLREFRPDRADLWEIYDAAGRLTGSVLVSEGRFTTPMAYMPHVQLLRATRDEAWGLTVDDLDVPILHRFRVVPGCR